MNLNLPSKIFIKKATALTVLVSILLFTQTGWFKQKFLKKNPSIVAGNQTIKELLDKDTNGNGVSDWEEKLWGLDPAVLYTGGVANKDIIETKKKSLNINPTSEDTEGVSPTDKLARELFALTVTLGQSDEIDSETLKSIAQKLGDSVKAKTSISYTIKDIRAVSTTEESLKKYSEDIIGVIESFDRNSADIDIVIESLQNADFSRLSELEKSSIAYKEYSKKLLTIPVPIGVVPYHLGIVNSFNGFGESFSYLSKIEDDGLSGLIGVAIYKAYNEKIVISLFNLEEYLKKYAII